MARKGQKGFFRRKNKPGNTNESVQDNSSRRNIIKRTNQNGSNQYKSNKKTTPNRK